MTLHQLLSLCNMRHWTHVESRTPHPPQPCLCVPRGCKHGNSGVGPHISRRSAGEQQASSWQGARPVHSGHHVPGLHPWGFPACKDISPAGNSKFDLLIQATPYICRIVYWYSELADTLYIFIHGHLRKTNWEPFKWTNFGCKMDCEQTRAWVPVPTQCLAHVRHQAMRVRWMSLHSMRLICGLCHPLCMLNLHASGWVRSFF